MFKIGDRVRAIEGDWNIHKGWKGTVMEEDDEPFIKWDKYYNPGTTTGYYALKTEYLVRIASEQEPYKPQQSYKIDLSWVKGAARIPLSKAVQEKAFELGYMWVCASYPIVDLCDRPYLFFKDGVYITHTSDPSWFEQSPCKEVSVNNWLEGKLPVDKPVYTPKRGDAVLVRDTPQGAWIARVFNKMNGKRYGSYGNSWELCIPFDAELVETTKESK